jgi:hypothetical protein
MYACFKQLTHGELRKSHVFFLSGFDLRQEQSICPTGGELGMSPPKPADPPVD